MGNNDNDKSNDNNNRDLLSVCPEAQTLNNANIIEHIQLMYIEIKIAII